MQQDMIRLRCVTEKGKLRMKIISSGYSPHANCQSPKAIRVEGMEYEIPRANVSLVETRGKFFYHVNKKNIKIVDSKNELKDPNEKVHVKVYGDMDLTECLICMSDEPTLIFVIFVKCGHYCACKTCAGKCKECPLCRAKIDQIITKEQLQ